MSSSFPQYQAVITGDVVRSGRLSNQKFRNVQEIIKRGGDELSQRFPQSMPLPIQMFRGDSWQFVVMKPVDALRIALFFRAYLRAEATIDTRLSIGVGTIDSPSQQSVGEGRGEAFVLSGAWLDKKTPSRMRFAMSNQTPDTWWPARSIAAVLSVLDVVVARWTSAQARAVCGALLEWKQERIAENWPGEPITQQAAGQHLARAGWEGAREALSYYEEVMVKWWSQ